MSAFSNIDRETFNWVRTEVSVSLASANEALQQFVDTDDKNVLFDLGNQLHQVVGSLQMLELKSLSALLVEGEMLLEDFIDVDSTIAKQSLSVLLESSLNMLNGSLEKMQLGQPESPIGVVELINQIRAVRGLDDVEISSLFSPNIEVFPEVNSQKALKDKVYIYRAIDLRTHYQTWLLQWLRDDEEEGLNRIKLVIEKVLQMSTFSSVARLWWVASAYADFLGSNELHNKSVHGRILRQLDDCLRKLADSGESALVRDPSEELIKIMLFYIGIGQVRTDRMQEIVDAFGLEHYFPGVGELSNSISFTEIKSRLNTLADNENLPLTLIRQMVGDYFENPQTETKPLDDIREQLSQVASSVAPIEVELVSDIVDACIDTVKGMSNGLVAADEETGFHFASSLIFLENSLNGVDLVDDHWLQNGETKLRALHALNNQQEVEADLKGAQLTGSERQALLDVVSAEVEENLKDIEANLEMFVLDTSKLEFIAGIDQKIRQVRGALQVLGEHKVGLLLQLAETQFSAIEQREVEPTIALTEALAIAIGTMEEYVKGLQVGRQGMDHLLDRSITDLEVAIGKKVSRSDVETLLDETSSALFTWLGNQSEFQLFTNVKSGLRDLLILAKKTKLIDVEHLIGEQNRLIDVISQEPAFLTDNITSNLQNNMASITEQIIHLYGTEDTEEDQQFDLEAASRIQSTQLEPGDAVQYHDDMDLRELAVDPDDEEAPILSSTEIGKQNAVSPIEQPMVDAAIFDVFIEESKEILEQAEGQYAECQSDATNVEKVRELRRSFHTLKGSARMVGLSNIGEVAWFTESLFNFCLDTGKPVGSSMMGFARDALDEIDSSLQNRYQDQHLIDIASWGARTENVDLDDDSLKQDSIEASTISVPTLTDFQPGDTIELTSEFDLVSELGIISASDFEDEGGESPNIESVTEISVIEIKTNDGALGYINDDESEKESGDDRAHSNSDIIDDEISIPSVMQDPQMREIFIAEASSNLNKVSEKLEVEPLIIEEDDTLSISIHTLLGNARTMGLAELAEAFDIAQDLCIRKQESGLAITEFERVSLVRLLGATRDCIQSAHDQPPFFDRDPAVWEKACTDLREAFDQASLKSVASHKDSVDDDIIEMEFGDSFLSVPLVDETEIDRFVSFDDAASSPEIDEDSELNDSDSVEELEKSEVELTEEPSEASSIENEHSGETTESEEDSEVLMDEEHAIEVELDLVDEDDHDSMGVAADEEASARVAAVFDGLDSIDDLLAEDDLVPETGINATGDASGDLNELEDSLDFFDKPASEGEASENDFSKELSIGARLFGAILGKSSQSEKAKVEEAIEETGDSEKPSDAGEFEHIVVEPQVDKIEPEADADALQSLIPDELTDLIETELLSLESAIQSERDNFKAEPSAESNDVESLEVEDELSTEDEPSTEQGLLISEEPATEEKPAADEELSEESTTDEQESETSSEAGEKVATNQLDDDFDAELAVVFVDELKGLHHELDDEVAKLSTMGEMAPAMANIMRHLHTIKGSSLMANKRSLGELTHQTESYLESNFIRNDDDLTRVRETLELYTDSVGAAANAFQAGTAFTVPGNLVEQLGAAESTQTAPLEELTRVNLPPVEPQGISEVEVSENVTAIATTIAEIDEDWKSARAWKTARGKMSQQYLAMLELNDQSGVLDPIAPLIRQGRNYIDGLELKKSAEFRDAKALIQELSDVVTSNAQRLVAGQALEGVSEVQSQLNLQSTGIATTVFVPAAEGNLSADEQSDLNRRERAATERAAALRIRTDTLDSLTNFVGDASMNRSQMREDVVSIKSVVDELYSNVQRFGTQLRELEIEADSKITSRTNERVASQRTDEFDPLELDRYTKLQQLSRGLAENLDELGTIQTSLSSFVHKTETGLQKQDRLNRELQDEIMQVRLVSFGGVAPQLRQVVRQTARDLNKDVALEIVGADVRMDKSILDGVVPALEHMLRNAVDHGIESPNQRRKKKKPKNGKIVLECRQVAREIVINVRDDGAGLDLEKIRSKAISDNLLSEGQQLKPEDMLMYISQSGFSTADRLTQISGRGVGMDVVQSTLRSMSGSIAYDVSDDQPGSSFTIRLPISLAVSSVVFIACGDTQFAVPARTVQRIVNIEAEELIRDLKADKPSIEVDGQRYALVDLADYLGIGSKLILEGGKRSVILVNAGVQNVAVIIDELFDTQEIVIKNLGGHLGRIPIYAGATIRADGQVVVLLDLVGISYYESFISLPDVALQKASTGLSVPRIMVVDDSLTVRKSAERDITALGINTVLAKDGEDAQIRLRQEAPDMILLDIEMPRMDGFELLEWIKSTERLAHIPVVMISSRATDKHINKATELGCSAFLGKPYLMENLVWVFNQHLTLESPISLDKN